jgi:hypothetical protein
MCFILLVNCSNRLADKQLKEHQPLKSNIDFYMQSRACFCGNDLVRNMASKKRERTCHKTYEMSSFERLQFGVRKVSFGEHASEENIDTGIAQ